MTGTSDRWSRLKDLAITAAVASAVGVVVTPWVRRLFDPPTPPPEPPPAPPTSEVPTMTLEDQLARLLEVPNPFPDPATRRSRREVEP